MEEEGSLVGTKIIFHVEERSVKLFKLFLETYNTYAYMY